MPRNVRVIAIVLTMVSLVGISCCDSFFGKGFPGRKTQAAVFVPNAWDTTDCIHELRGVYVVTLGEPVNANIDDLEQMRGLVRAVWTADRDGKTKVEIRQLFDKMAAVDIVKNGI